MTTVSITEAKNQLSALLDKVKAGESVLILDRGVPVARIVPVTRDRDAPGRTERLVRAGILRPGSSKAPSIKDLQARAPQLPAGVSGSETLIEERRGGR